MWDPSFVWCILFDFVRLFFNKRNLESITPASSYLTERCKAECLLLIRCSLNTGFIVPASVSVMDRSITAPPKRIGVWMHCAEKRCSQIFQSYNTFKHYLVRLHVQYSGTNRQNIATDTLCACTFRKLLNNSKIIYDVCFFGFGLFSLCIVTISFCCFCWIFSKSVQNWLRITWSCFLMDMLFWNKHTACIWSIESWWITNTKQQTSV